MAQKRVIVTIERPDDHEDQLQHSRDLKSAIDAGTPGLSTTALGADTTAAQVKQDAMATRAGRQTGAR
jgi:hypothetical protein